MSEQKARRRITLVVLVLAVLLLLALLFNPSEIDRYLVRLLPLSPLLVPMLVAGYLSDRAGPDTRRGRRWRAVGVALGSIGILVHLGLQHLLEGIEPLHVFLAVLAVGLALAALWAWISSARLPDVTT